MTRTARRPSANDRAVMVLDRTGGFHSFVREALSPGGYRVLWAETTHEARAALEAAEVAAVLVDVCAPGSGLLPELESMIRIPTAARVIVVTGCPLMDAAARVLYPNADGFLQRPCAPDDLRRLVAGTFKTAPPRDPLPVPGIIGSSPGIARVFGQIREVAPTESNVLIVGETGTGKELVAAAIHRASSRRDRPYVVLDTLALSENLLETELFGHTKGAFTGALRNKAGLFEAANGGTIFLDEIGDVPPAVQVRLLRAIQERQIRRVGATSPAAVDVRVIAATQWKPDEAVESGRLRADLYYRLSVYNIEIPPLRARIEDIPALVQEAVNRAGGTGAARACSDLALEMLQSYHWPGNVRELFAVCERALIGGDGLRATALPERVREAWRTQALAEGPSKRQEAIASALAEADGHRETAAELLGVSRTTLWRWLQPDAL